VIDWGTKFEGKEQESCIKGRRVTKSLANARRFTSVIMQGSTHGSDGRRDSVAEVVKRIRASQSRCGIFPTGRVVSFLWEGGGYRRE
jgi:hypothetical protein